MNKDEVNLKKEEYLKTLSIRLVEERNNQNLTQQDLADKTSIPREKINYTELNLKGRKLQIEELALIAETLKLSTDYLLGLTENNNVTTNNTLLEEFEDIELLNDLKVYSIVVYANKIILTSTIKSIESKINERILLSSADTQKLAFLISYLDCFRVQRVRYSNYVRTLLEEHEEEIRSARNEIGQLLLYNEHEDIEKIDFSKIRKLAKLLNEFERYVKLELKEQLGTIIDSISEKISKDDKYYYKAVKMLREISKQK